MKVKLPDNTDFTILSAWWTLAGGHLPIRCKKVYATGTTATGIHALA